MTRLRWDDLNNNKKWLGCSVFVRVQPAPTSSDGLEGAMLGNPGPTSTSTSTRLNLHTVGRAGSRFAGAALQQRRLRLESRCSVGALDRELFKRRRRRRDPGLNSGHVKDAGGADVEQAMAELYKPGVSHFLDMRRIASYAPDLGFSIAVDGLRNIPSRERDCLTAARTRRASTRSLPS